MSKQQAAQQKQTQEKPAAEQQAAEPELEQLPRSHYAALLGTGAPDDLLSRLDRMPRVNRQQAVLQLQRQHGNAFVQRLLASRATPRRAPAQLVQRQVGGFTPGKGVKFSPKEKEIKFDRPIPGVPITFAAIKIGGEGSYSVVQEGAEESVQVGVTGRDHGAGVYGEVTKEWEKYSSPFGDVTVQSKAEADVTTKGGQIGLLLVGVKTKHASIGLKFNLLSYDVEKSELEFPNVAIPVDIIPVTGKTTAPDGTKISYELKATITFVFKPDWVRIGKWIGQQFAKAAAAELAVAGSMVMAGIATLAAAYVTASLGSEVSERVERAIKLTNEFCAAYEATMKGSGGAKATSEFGQKGAATAQCLIKKANLPPEAFHEAAKKRNLRSEAFAVGWPQVKQMILQDYRNEHDIEWWVYGEKGPGYKLLKRLLDEPEYLRF